MAIRHVLLAASAVALTLAYGCSGEEPAEPSAAAPAPTPVPTAAATPAPSASPAASGCQLAPLPDHGNCSKSSSRNEFRTAVNVVIDELIAQRPDLFDFTQDAGGGSYLVVNRNGYMRQIQNRLTARGFCVVEGQDELGVKNTNAFNEQWNVITSRDFIRRAYITTCVPAAF